MIDVDDYYTVLCLQAHAKEAGLSIYFSLKESLFKLNIEGEEHSFHSAEEILGFIRAIRCCRGDFKKPGTEKCITELYNAIGLVENVSGHQVDFNAEKIAK